ncbi:hypothetical protein HG530_000538 [Fusarium avenaceum]|nr:hypothetical protein HG530_000538 [Fusarium avenaceum]
MAATDHTERFGRVKDGCARNKSHCFFSSIDDITDLLADSQMETNDIRINLVLCRISTHSKDAVLRLDMNSRIGRQERNSQRGNSNTQVDVVSRLQLFRSSSRDTIPSLLSFIRSLGRPILSIFSQLEHLNILLRGGGNDSIDENSRKVDIVGVDFASFDDVLGFDDVGVKNAGMPAPAARMRSARVPCGQSSIANSPVRYFFSSTLLFPRYDKTKRSTWPALVSTANPPLPSTPALFDTAVSEFRESRPRRFRAPIRVSATPQRPNPELKSVEPLLISATAASASLKSLDCPRTAKAALVVLNWRGARTVKLLPQVTGLALWILSIFDMIAVVCDLTTRIDGSS